jgi:hypothetical protein
MKYSVQSKTIIWLVVSTPQKNMKVGWIIIPTIGKNTNQIIQIPAIQKSLTSVPQHKSFGSFRPVSAGVFSVPGSFFSFGLLYAMGT